MTVAKTGLLHFIDVVEQSAVLALAVVLLLHSTVR
jgi:hypothetical protein